MHSLRESWERLNRRAAEWVAGAVGLLAVVVLAGASSWAEGLGAGLLFIGLLAGSFAAIVAHELGHALAAWAVGWRVWIISALPVCLRLGFAPRLSAELRRDVGGYVLASPRTDAHDSRWRGVVVSAGGPLTSFALGAAPILWLMRFPAGSWETPQQAGLLGSALAFSFYSLLAGAYSAWPVRMADGAPNDAGMIVEEIAGERDEPEARAAFWAFLLFEHGIEPGAWPAWMREGVRSACAGPAPSALAVYLGFAAALEAEDVGAARALVSGSAHDLAKVLRAYLLACVDDAPDAAEAELAAVEEDLDWDGLLRFRALALVRILAADGDDDGARRRLDELSAEIARAPTPEPFWERALTRARLAASAGEARERTRSGARAPLQQGPWGGRA
jgi:hypothetical protein